MNYARMKGPGDFDPPEEKPSIWETEGGGDYLEERLYKLLGQEERRRELVRDILEMVEGAYSAEETGLYLMNRYSPLIEAWEKEYFSHPEDV